MRWMGWSDRDLLSARARLIPRIAHLMEREARQARRQTTVRRR
jgi:hypothetical protein